MHARDRCICIRMQLTRHPPTEYSQYPWTEAAAAASSSRRSRPARLTPLFAILFVCLFGESRRERGSGYSEGMLVCGGDGEEERLVVVRSSMSLCRSIEGRKERHARARRGELLDREPQQPCRGASVSQPASQLRGERNRPGRVLARTGRIEPAREVDRTEPAS